LIDRIRIIVIDDHPLFRKGVVQTLSAEPEFQVIAQAESGEEAVQLATEFLPDIILLDIGIPGGGINTAQKVTSVCPATKIVMLTVSEDAEHLAAAFRAGARAYILKGVSAHELVQILVEVAAGDVYVSPMLASNLLLEKGLHPSENDILTNSLLELTKREYQILELVATGLSNKEIGEKLFLSEKTVKHYMTNILEKLQVHNRVEAALIAQRARIENLKH
jgi:two-component system, NarL family, nitrate/nitrite response regulator NarL